MLRYVTHTHINLNIGPNTWRLGGDETNLYSYKGSKYDVNKERLSHL